MKNMEIVSFDMSDLIVTCFKHGKTDNHDDFRGLLMIFDEFLMIYGPGGWSRCTTMVRTVHPPITPGTTHHCTDTGCTHGPTSAWTHTAAPCSPGSFWFQQSGHMTRSCCFVSNKPCFLSFGGFLSEITDYLIINPYAHQS